MARLRKQGVAMMKRGCPSPFEGVNSRFAEREFVMPVA